MLKNFDHVNMLKILNIPISNIARPQYKEHTVLLLCIFVSMIFERLL